MEVELIMCFESVLKEVGSTNAFLTLYAVGRRTPWAVSTVYVLL